MNEVMLYEASTTTYQKKYKCPYCEGRFIRSKLHIHIQNKHEEMIPEGYTALRVAFNTINNKDHGSCIMCGKETAWNENKGRYERLCADPKCHEAYKKMAAERNQKKYGTDRLQTDPRYAEEVQKRALSKRKISGEYKFASGKSLKYVGSYEKNFLEFMDKVMQVEVEDLVSPGPSISYEWRNGTHIYLPDFYYIPYNLIIEIKDGGDNPNKNPAIIENRQDRLLAKEAAIKASGQYNYVRIVDNRFEELMSAMALLKYNLINKCYDPILMVNESTHINEDMGSCIGAALAPNPNPFRDYYIIQAPQNNVFDYSITSDPIQYTMYSVDPTSKGFYKTYKTDKSKFSNKYLTFKIKDKQKAKELYDELAMLNQKGELLYDDKYDPSCYIYSRLTEGSKLLSDEQLLFDDRFELVRSFDESIVEMCSEIYDYLTSKPININEQINSLTNEISEIERSLHG